MSYKNEFVHCVDEVDESTSQLSCKELEFTQRLTNLAPGWVDAIDKYGLMYEVFSTFLNDFGDVKTISDKDSLQRVNSAMLEWDI